MGARIILLNNNGESQNEYIARKPQADRILYEFRLLKKLEEVGVPHIIGSYRMDMMAWNDLDIDIENDGMSLDKLYELSSFILNTFHPTWNEAKEEINEDGKRVWFHGFETTITGELWNIDLWFFDKETIKRLNIIAMILQREQAELKRIELFK